MGPAIGRLKQQEAVNFQRSTVSCSQSSQESPVTGRNELRHRDAKTTSYRSDQKWSGASVIQDRTELRGPWIYEVKNERQSGRDSFYACDTQQSYARSLLRDRRSTLCLVREHPLGEEDRSRETAEKLFSENQAS